MDIKTIQQDKTLTRAEKRRAERALKKFEKVKNNKRIMSNKEIAELKKETFDKAFDSILVMLFAIPTQVLSENGYGQKRLTRIHNRMLELLKEVEKGEVDIYELADNMERKFGLKFIEDEKKGK